MRGIDTNVIVRLLTNDDVQQVARARQAIAFGETFIPTTVLIEAEWVLRSTYRLSPAAIVRQLRAFVAVAGMRVEDPQRLAQAFDWADEGMDFADALHFAWARDCTTFVTFDRALVKTAARLSAIPVVEP